MVSAKIVPPQRTKSCEDYESMMLHCVWEIY